MTGRRVLAWSVILIPVWGILTAFVAAWIEVFLDGIDLFGAKSLAFWPGGVAAMGLIVPLVAVVCGIIAVVAWAVREVCDE